MGKTIVIVNRNVIAANRKHGRNDPPLSVRRSGQRVVMAHEVRLGQSTLVHQPDKPLSCGARVWIETDYPVEVVR